MKVQNKYYEEFNIELGQEVTVAKLGTQGYIHGEPATFTRTTKQQMVFTTESGATVRCPLGDISHTIGKAGKFGYFVMLRKFEDINNIIRESVRL